MTMSNYKTLAKMVNKQRLKQVEPGHDSTTGDSTAGGDKSFFSKKQMLEARIEKLRKLESQVKSDTYCTKDNCTVAIDPRTTSERYQNDSALSAEL